MAGAAVGAAGAVGAVGMPGIVDALPIICDMLPLTVADFDFELPPELIAQHPAADRSASRLLDGTGPAPVDRTFRDLPALLMPGDLLVFNDTRVIKARLFGRKASGGAVELLVERIGPGCAVWAHLRASKSPRAGTGLRLADAFDAEVLGRGGPDGSLFHLRFPSDPLALLDAHGHVPLPPYITTPTVPTTWRVTRPSLPPGPARWRRRPRRCTSTPACSTRCVAAACRRRG